MSLLSLSPSVSLSHCLITVTLEKVAESLSLHHGITPGTSLLVLATKQKQKEN